MVPLQMSDNCQIGGLALNTTLKFFSSKNSEILLPKLKIDAFLKLFRLFLFRIEENLLFLPLYDHIFLFKHRIIAL
jgi:hypothetical protein